MAKTKSKKSKKHEQATQPNKEQPVANDVKNNFPDSASMDRVTDPVMNRPTENVTEAASKDPAANTLNQAESSAQENVRAATASKVAEEDDTGYTYEIEQGKHKVVVKPEHGLNYNYHAVCTCQWEGRFVTANDAEAGAKKHINRNP